MASGFLNYSSGLPASGAITIIRIDDEL